MKVLNPRTHGIIDYVLVALFALAPTLFGFEGTPQTLCYVLAVVHLSMSLLTAYPLGAMKLVPFPIHGALEAGVGVLLLVLPWLLGFSEVESARNFFLATGALVAVVVLLTDYKAHELSEERPAGATVHRS